MWIALGIISMGTLISIFEVPPLVKKKLWKDIIIYFFFLTNGMLLSILLSLGVKIPTPLDFITKLYSPFTKMLEKMLA
jgi:nitric oxide reductase large subunit